MPDDMPNEGVPATGNAEEAQTIRRTTDGGPSSPEVPPTEPKGRPFGRYLLLSELGHGGMGVVWKAWDSQLRRIVALKGILAEEFADPTQVERFMREARASARLSHPNIVPVHDVGEYEGHHYFTTEYIEGRSLDTVMREPVPLKQALAWVKTIAEALHCAHTQGIVHRDVKPGNVLIDKDGQPHVMDFGLAKQVDAGPDATRNVLTLSGDVLGTPRYMSPEQTRGAAGVGPASDQFSLGVVLYELLTGETPFAGGDMRSLLEAIAETDPVRPTSLNPRIHRDIETICLKALEKDPSRRYATATDLAADIGRYFDGEPIQARPVTPLERLARKASRHRGLVTLGAMAILLGLVAGGYAIHARRTSVERDIAKRNEAAAKESEAAALAKVAKVEAISKVFARWALLFDSLRAMEAIAYDSSRTPDQRRADAQEPWKDVDAFLRATPPDSASQATAKALAGWASRYAGESDRGAEWMIEAQSIDPAVPYGAMMRALVLFSAYVDELPEPRIVLRTSGMDALPMELPSTNAARREEIERELATVRACRVWGKENAEAFELATKGIDAMQSGDYATADECISRALAAPDLRAFEMVLRFARARAREYMRAYDDALKDYAALLSIHPKDAHLRRRAACVRHAKGIEEAYRGKDPRPTLELALKDLQEATQLSPTLGTAWQTIGDVRVVIAQAQAQRGLPWEQEFARAIEAYDKAVEYSPEEPAMLLNRASARESLGNARLGCGTDPGPDFDLAMADVELAAPRMPAHLIAAHRCKLHRLRAKAAEARGEDPRDEACRAIEDGTRACQGAPRLPEMWVTLGLARSDLGAYQARRGEDPGPAWNGAVEDFTEAISLQADYADALEHRSYVWWLLGQRDIETRVDPAASFGKAMADIDEAIRVRPDSWYSWNTRGLVWLYRYRARTDGLTTTGPEPQVCLERAAAEFEAAVARNPKSALALKNLATATLFLGETKRVRGEDPRPEYQKAIQAFSAAIEQAPSAATLADRGEARQQLAEEEARRGLDGGDTLRLACDDFLASIEKRDSWKPHLLLAQAYMHLSEPAKAVTEYDRAIELLSRGSHEFQAMVPDARARRSLAAAAAVAIRGDDAGAKPLWEAYLAEAKLSDETRPDFALAHYHLARGHALASTGKTGPAAQATAVAPEEAATLRDEAFSHLAKAISLGWADRKATEEEPSFVPLRDDPRWKELLSRIGR